MRLIDAEILRDRLYKTRYAELADGRNKAYGKGIRDAIEIVEQQPTVEPEFLKEQETEWCDRCGRVRLKSGRCVNDKGKGGEQE